MILKNPSNNSDNLTKHIELEQHFIRLLDSLVELEERISSLEKSREVYWEETMGDDI